jgi:hypothetical protein
MKRDIVLDKFRRLTPFKDNRMKNFYRNKESSLPRDNKGIITVFFPLVCGFLVFLAACAGTPAKKTETKDEFSGSYFTGAGGAGIRLAVLQPQGRAEGNKELPQNEQYLLGFIQGNLTTDFTKYSAMTIIDRQTITQVLEEQNNALLRNTGDRSSLIQIGNITNAQFLLTGGLEKIGANSYAMTLNIVDAETAELKTAYYTTVDLTSLRSMKPLREASIDLLKRMGVDLTPEGEEAIRSVSTTEAQSAVALAQGIAAESGNSVERLIYLTNAVAFDSSQLEAISLLASAEESVTEMGTGSAIIGDLERQNQFQKMMEQYEEHYSTHPPFELVFVPKTIQFGETDYANHEARVQFNITLRRSVEFETMQKVLAMILDNLKKTGNKDKWGFKDWPRRAGIFNTAQVYKIKAELLNNAGDPIDEVEFMMTAQLIIVGSKIYASTTQDIFIPFKKMAVELMVGEPQVKIVQINDKTAQESFEEDYIRISSELKLPPKQGNSGFMFGWHRNITPILNKFSKKDKK